MVTDGDEFLLLAKYTGQKTPQLLNIGILNPDCPETMGGKDTWKNEHTKGNEKTKQVSIKGKRAGEADHLV